MNYDHLQIEETKKSYKIQNGVISSIKNSHLIKHGFRRFEKDRIFQSSRLGNTNLDILSEENKKFAGGGIEHNYGWAKPHVEKRLPDAMDTGAIQDEFSASLESLTKKFPEFIFRGGLSLQSKSINLQSSYGLNLSSSGDLCEWFFIYQRRGSGNTMDGYFFEAASKPNIQTIIEQQADFLKANQIEAKLVSGRMPVLFVESMTPIKKLTESFQIDKYSENVSLFSGKLGEKLFDSRVSIYDEGYNPSTGHLQFFDGEGTVRSERVPLVKKGVFSALLSDLRYAHKFGATSSGNGLRDYDRGVILQPKELRFEGGPESWISMVKKMDRCLVAVVAAGGDSNDLGEFSTPVQAGFVFEKGELVGRAPQVTLKTSVASYLGKDLIGVSSDGFFSQSGAPCVLSEVDILVN